MSRGVSLLKGCLALQSISQLAVSFAVVRALPGRVIIHNSVSQQPPPPPQLQPLLATRVGVNNAADGGAFAGTSRLFPAYPSLPVAPTTTSSSSSSSSSFRMSGSNLSEVGASPRWEGFWSAGLKVGDKWDTGTVSPALQKLLDEGVLPKGRSLVPGCGRGYDAIAFGKSGYDSLGLDLSPTGVGEAKALLAEQTEKLSGKVEFRSGDFFKFSAKEEGKFDVILDYTFLCALDPSIRDDWADHMVSLLSPGGELVTLIFPIVDKEDGPPFAVSEEIVSGLLQPRGLEAVHLEKLPPNLCHTGREGKTALGRWRFSKAA